MIITACTNDQVNETQGVASRRKPKPKAVPGIRTQLLALYDVPQAFWKALQAKKLVKDIAPCLAYARIRPRSSRFERIPMNVDLMVQKWMKVVPALALGHTKDDVDRAEAEVEELLTPLLDAPVKQLREFVPKLIAAMKADPQVPFFIWRAFEVWTDNLVKAPDEKVKVLKKQLASEIVDLVEEDVRPDLREAMIRALMWRDPEVLEETKAAAITAKAKGQRARAVGRESCLFLQIPTQRGRHTEVML